jgi:hydroxymethylglutaryl-CoA lyase
MTKEKVDIIEVGPRDGLQSIKEILPISNKKNLIRHLIQCGFEHIEAGSFVRFDKVPAMSGSDEIANELKEYNNNQLWYLAPNLKGLQSALNHGVSQIALFTAVSESFNQKNIGMSVEKSLSVIKSCLDYLKDK